MNQPLNIPPIPGLPPELMQAAMGQVGPIQKSIFAFLAKKVGGKTRFRSKQIHEVEEVVKWLNEKKDIYVLAVLPDFKSYSYHILYEEIDDAS